MPSNCEFLYSLEFRVWIQHWNDIRVQSGTQKKRVGLLFTHPNWSMYFFFQLFLWTLQWIDWLIEFNILNWNDKLQLYQLFSFLSKELYNIIAVAIANIIYWNIFQWNPFLTCANVWHQFWSQIKIIIEIHHFVCNVWVWITVTNFNIRFWTFSNNGNVCKTQHNCRMCKNINMRK